LLEAAGLKATPNRLPVLATMGNNSRSMRRKCHSIAPGSDHQGTQHFQVFLVPPVCILKLGRFNDFRYAAEPLIVHDQSEGFDTDTPFTDVLVAVNPRI
jgi:hypothetical protein